MVKEFKLVLPAADLGNESPMPDIKNVSYIHAGFKTTNRVSRGEKKHLGKGMIQTILPYKMQNGYNRVKKPREFNAISVENDHIRAVFLPELGGRLWSLYDKDNKHELLYVNPVFQPGNLGLRNAWFSGGVEFNVGIKGHNPLTCSPLHAVIETTPDGEVLRLYEYERIRGVVYSVSAWVNKNSPVLYIRCRIENLSDHEKYMYWWSNIAVPETKGTRIIVPAAEAFVSFYNTDHYLIDKTAVPLSGGVDASYPCNIATSRDFFYKIPKDSHKWIAAVNEQGKGLLQCSTNRLFGRKLFAWGMAQGGRHWNEWLSERGSAYIEMQAGLARTQLEHIPMKGKESWEWVEAYTGICGNATDFHGDYKAAVDRVEQVLTEKIGDPKQLYFPPDETVTASRTVAYGSDFGSLEEAVRKQPISKTLNFPQVDSAQTVAWRQLLETGSFPCPGVEKEPESYMVDEFWRNRLKALKAQNWYSYLQLGVAEYALSTCGKGTAELALAYFLKSNKAAPNAWALRNIAMLYKNEYKKPEEAVRYILLAFKLKPDCAPLCVETAEMLTACGRPAEWLKIYEGLSPKLQKLGRLRLYKAVALVQLNRLNEAAEILKPGFEMPDVKEGEYSVSQLWFELYGKIFAKETGVVYSPNNKAFICAANLKYPLPAELDFRMD